MGTVEKYDPPGKRAVRVLVVDDDLDTVHTFAMLLRLHGYEVEFAINGFAAMDVARRFKPQVVFLDMGLPDFSGYAIARQLKWEPGLEGLRIIAVSGRSDERTRKEARSAGCEAYVVKPVEPRVLADLVEGRFDGTGHEALG